MGEVRNGGRDADDRGVGGARDAAEAVLRDLGAFIREQRHGAQLSLRRLAHLAGVSNPYLSQIERGLRRPSAEILSAIAQALRISAETLYVRAGLLDAPDDDLAARIATDPRLTEAQRQALLEVHRSFLDANERAADRRPAAPDRAATDHMDLTDRTDPGPAPSGAGRIDTDREEPE